MPVLTTVWIDVWREYRRSPAGPASMIALFSLLNAALLLGLSCLNVITEPVSRLLHPENVFVVQARMRDTGQVRGLGAAVSGEVAARKRTFARTAVVIDHDDFVLSIGTSAGPKFLRAGLASSAYFMMFGHQAALGRLLAPEDDGEDASCRMLLTKAVWTSYFGGKPDLIGRDVPVNGSPCTVTGVIERDEIAPGVEVWFNRPDSEVELQNNSMAFRWPRLVVVEVRAGVKRATAEREVQDIYAGLSRSDPRLYSRMDGILTPLSAYLWANVQKLVRLLSGLMGALLILCGANAALLMALRRRRHALHDAVRLALGMPRGQRYLRIGLEATSITAAGLVGGLGLASLVRWSLLPWLAPDGPMSRLADLRSAQYAWLLVCNLVSLCVLLAARLRARKAEERSLAMLRSASGGDQSEPHAWTARWLLLCESFVCAAVLTASAYSSHALISAYWKTAGFEKNGLYAAMYDVAGEEYREGVKLKALQRRLRDRIAGLPGVRAVSITSSFPVAGSAFLVPAGRDRAGSLEMGARQKLVEQVAADRDYFQTLGIRLLLGTDFRELGEDEALGSAVVDEDTLGLLEVSRQNALGTTFYLAGAPYRIVGVSAAIRFHADRRRSVPQVVLNHTLGGVEPPQFTVVVRALGGGPATVAGLTVALSAAEPSVPPRQVVAAGAIVDDATRSQKRLLAACMFAAMLALVMVIASSALLVAGAVHLRRRDFAIRLALGSEPARHLWALAAPHVAPLAVGTAVGAWVALRVLEPLHALFLSEPDPVSAVTVTCLATVFPGALPAVLPGLASLRRLDLSSLLRA